MPVSASVAPLAVAVKPPAPPPLKYRIDPEPGKYALVSEAKLKPAADGAEGAVVSTLTVVVSVVALPTLSVPVSVSR